ncbi:hypothetical protein ACHHYP_08060 [Achlya hypogyna]|uniref:SMP-30/Gluconolactonase/LRE-like region domain-containing protein n=1 Tax=Achlya hypogyna TaxID=1202772 RepID=A0A1V9YQ22_ACHHY|nr:hypothetical protein ACHHYP_08060 [Achlya hypogyna]
MIHEPTGVTTPDADAATNAAAETLPPEEKKKTKIPPIVFVPLLGAFVVITVVPSVVSNLMNKSPSPSPAPPSSTTTPSVGGSGTKGWDFTPAPAPPPPSAASPTYGLSTEFASLFASANITGVALSSLAGSWVALNETTAFTAQTALFATSVSSLASIAADDSGNLYFADPRNQQIVVRSWNASGPLDYSTLGNASVLTQPRGLAFCASCPSVLFAADGGQIQSFPTNGTAASTLLTGLTNASDVALDSTGAYLYIADAGAHCIRRVRLANRSLETWAGKCGTMGFVDGARLASRWNSPGGLAIDVRGNVYVSDSGNHVVRKVDGTSAMTTTLVGSAGLAGWSDSATGTGGLLNRPLGLAINASLDWTVAGNGAFSLYVADSGNNCVRRITKLT